MIYLFHVEMTEKRYDDVSDNKCYQCIILYSQECPLTYGQRKIDCEKWLREEIADSRSRIRALEFND